MDATQHIQENSFTIEKNKWIENYKKKEHQLDEETKHFLEIKSHLREELSPKDKKPNHNTDEEDISNY